jgi:hypothetical protein
MRGKTNPLCALGLTLLLLSPSAVNAQAGGQIWANVTFDWLRTERLSYELDFEPKSQFLTSAGQPTWVDLDAIGTVEYAISKWLDVLGEMDTGRKEQINHVDSVTVTPRIGAHLHLLSRILQTRGGRRGAEREKLPMRRLVAGTLVRLENQNTYYSTDAPAKSAWQVRYRFELAYPLNRKKTTLDGAVYLTSDGEVFMPVNTSVTGGIVNQLRVRSGLGYRRSFGVRFEALYIWIGERNETSGVLAPQSHALDIRITRVF